MHYNPKISRRLPNNSISFIWEIETLSTTALPRERASQDTEDRWTVCPSGKDKLCVSAALRQLWASEVRPNRTTSVRTRFFPRSNKYRLSFSARDGREREMHLIPWQGNGKRKPGNKNERHVSRGISSLCASLMSSGAYRSFILSGPPSSQFLNDNQNHYRAERSKKRKT